MPRLVVLKGERRGELVDLTRPLIIGSDRSSDLHFRDVQVSWRHARIWLDRQGITNLEDLGSANGTFLNGTSIKNGRVRPGDLVQIGGVELALLPGGPDELGEDSPDHVLRKLHEAREKVELLTEERSGLASRVENLSARVAALSENKEFLQRELGAESSRHEKEMEKLLGERAEREKAVLALDSALAETARQTREIWAVAGVQVDEERERARKEREDLMSRMAKMEEEQKATILSERGAHEAELVKLKEDATAERDRLKVELDQDVRQSRLHFEEVLRALKASLGAREEAHAGEMARLREESTREKEDLRESLSQEIKHSRSQFEEALEALKASLAVREEAHAGEIQRLREESTREKESLREGLSQEVHRTREQFEEALGGLKATLAAREEAHAAEVGRLREDAAREKEALQEALGKEVQWSREQFEETLNGLKAGQELREEAHRGEIQRLREEASAEKVALLQAGEEESQGLKKKFEQDRVALIQSGKADLERMTLSLQEEVERRKELEGALAQAQEAAAAASARAAEQSGTAAALGKSLAEEERIREILEADGVRAREERDSLARERDGLLERILVLERECEKTRLELQSLAEKKKSREEELLSRLEMEKRRADEDRAEAERLLQAERNEVESLRESAALLEEELKKRDGALARKEDELSGLRKKRESKVAALVKKQEEEIAGLKRQHASEMEDLRREREEALAALRGDHDAALQEAVSRARKEAAELGSRHRKEIGAARDEQKTAMARAEEEIQTLRGYVSELRGRLSDREQKLREQTARLREKVATRSLESAQ